MPRFRDDAVPAALRNFDTLPDSANVSARVVCGLHECCRQTVWRRVAAGKLPAPRKIGSSTRWNVGELRAAMGMSRSQA